MDPWQRLVEDEREELRFFLREEFGKDTEMNKNVVENVQEEALSAFNRVPQSEAAQWAQVVMTAEFALQQARTADALERIAQRLDGWNANGVPVEHVGGH